MPRLSRLEKIKPLFFMQPILAKSFRELKKRMTKKEKKKRRNIRAIDGLGEGRSINPSKRVKRSLSKSREIQSARKGRELLLIFRSRVVFWFICRLGERSGFLKKLNPTTNVIDFVRSYENQDRKKGGDSSFERQPRGRSKN